MVTDVYRQILSQYEAEGRLRRLPAVDPAVRYDLTSNDYLGLAEHPELVAQFLSQSRQPQFTSAASRLLSSRQRAYTSLENYLGAAYGRKALLFNSGYHANSGCVSALAVTGTTIIADKLIHASVIDGIRLSGAPFRRFRHNDVDSLRRELKKAADGSKVMIVIVESIYSMDGDEAPLREIAALKHEFPAMLLYVDEAHALGVRGSRGLGVCEEFGILPEVDVLVGTFGKAVASAGAFAAVSPLLYDFLVNNARSLIFSTALPPVNVAFTEFMLRHIADLEEVRAHLAELGTAFRCGIARITGGPCISTTQIVPLMAAGNARALALSDALRCRGVLALPIRRPTVPAGTERLRFSLNANLSQRDVDNILSEIAAMI